MLLLTLFAVLAGAATAVSPCVLPVLPAVLSAGATGGRRRPLGVVTGLTITFTVTIVGLAEVADGVGLGTSVTRDIAIGALLVFGLAVLVPAVGDRLEARLSPLARFGPRRLGDGFGSGLFAGAALGFVYAPCAGPILAAVITVGTASGNALVVGAGYAVGSAAVLLLLALGGRAVLDRVRGAGRGPLIQRALGAVMVLTAIAMAGQLDVRFQSAIAAHLPDVVVDPARGIEDSHAVKSRLAGLQGGPRFAPSEAKAATPVQRRGTPSSLPVLGRAPDFTGTQEWFNTPGGRPLTLASLRGRVVLVDFWTYTCINCIRTLPYLKAWDARYRRAGLTIVGVHSPEFSFEKDAGNVRRAIAQDGLRYPVVQDNDLATWNAWGNQYWPAEYLIDTRGRVRRAEAGEGGYAEQEQAIRSLLAERGDRDLGADARPHGVVVPGQETSPETYVGARRAEGWVGTPPAPGTRTYPRVAHIPLNGFALGGRWRITQERATAVRDATIDATVQARRVYLVLSSPSRTRTVRVRFRGRDLQPVVVHGQTLYTLVDGARSERGRLHLRLDPGVSAFAFTFG